MPKDTTLHNDACSHDSRTEAVVPVPPAFRLGRHVAPLVILFATFGVFLPELMVQAGIKDTAVDILGWIVHVFVTFLGNVIVVMVGVLINVAQYNGFIDSPAVVNGWSIVRDVANMFFIVVLLVIAFGTMLGVSKYNYKTTLPTLLIMAVVVNFSRTICGLIIDFAQVVMLTFVHGFKEAAAGNFIEAFGITKSLQLRPDAPTSDAAFTTVVSFILALVLALGSLAVIILIVATLVARMVILWLLVVLSPLAFLARTAPFSAGQSMYSQWWSKFVNEVMIGPFLAFFLWLSLVSVAGGAVATQGFEDTSGTGDTVAAGSTEAFTTTAMQQYIIAMGLLIGGVQMSLSMGSAAGSIGKSATSGAAKYGYGAARKAARGGLALGRGGGRLAGRGLRKVSDVSGLTGTAENLGSKAKTGLATFGLGNRLTRGTSEKMLLAQNQKKSAVFSAAHSREQGFTAEQTSLRAKNIKVRDNMTQEQRAKAQATLQKNVKDISEGKVDPNKSSEEVAKEYHSNLAKLKQVSGNDPTVMKEVAELQRKQPSLIIDKSADAKTQQSQVEAYKKTVGSMKMKDIGNLKPAELKKGEFVATLDPSTLEKALQSNQLSGDQKTALQEGQVAPVDFAYLPPEQKVERASQLTAAEAGDSSIVPPAAVTAAVAVEMNRDALKAFAGNLGKSSVEPKDLSSNGELAGKLHNVMTPAQISNLPKEMRTALAEGLRGEQDIQGALDVSGDMKAAFASFDPNSGNMRDAEDLKGLREMMQSKEGRVAAASSLGEKGLGVNGGVSEVSIEMMSNIEFGDIQVMMQEGKVGEATALLEIAGKMKEKGTTQVGAAADKAFVASSNEAIAKAVENAEKIVAQMDKGITPIRKASKEMQKKVAKMTADEDDEDEDKGKA